MVKSITWREALLDLFFLNIPFTLLGDAAGLLGSAAPGSVYMSLHESDPGPPTDGNQQTNETTYTGYNPAARVAVPRTGAGWVRVDHFLANVAQVTFAANSGSTTHTITHVGAGTSVSGAGKLCYRTALTTPWVVTPGFTPQADIQELAYSER
jgi:hypothetical protein